MAKSKRLSLKVFDLDNVRLGLLIYSLYLTAFEILKSTIVNGVADFYVDQDTESDKRHKEFKDFLASVGANQREIEEYLVGAETFSSQVEKYEQEVAKNFGYRFTERDHKGLIPSCRWLQEEGVLTEDDIRLVREAREQRNQIAHRLHDMLVYEGLKFDIDILFKMRGLTKKVELFWVRLHISIDYPEIYQIPDKDVFCPRLFIMDQIGRAVVEYINASNAKEGLDVH